MAQIIVLKGIQALGKAKSRKIDLAMYKQNYIEDIKDFKKSLTIKFTDNSFLELATIGDMKIDYIGDDLNSLIGYNINEIFDIFDYTKKHPKIIILLSDMTYVQVNAQLIDIIFCE